MEPEVLVEHEDGILASNDAREGAAAFAERRPAKWTGT